VNSIPKWANSALIEGKFYQRLRVSGGLWCPEDQDCGLENMSDEDVQRTDKPVAFFAAKRGSV
jgi:hypothetical protein